MPDGARSADRVSATGASVIVLDEGDAVGVAHRDARDPQDAVRSTSSGTFDRRIAGKRRRDVGPPAGSAPPCRRSTLADLAPLDLEVERQDAAARFDGHPVGLRAMPWSWTYLATQRTPLPHISDSLAVGVEHPHAGVGSLGRAR